MTRLQSRGRSSCARRGFTFIELLVVIGLIVFVCALLASCVRRQNEGSGRVRCASNLRQIGQAILLYSNDNRGAYPRTRASIGPDRKPVWGTNPAATQPFKDDGPAENDVTAALF